MSRDLESEKFVYHIYPYLPNLDSSLFLYKLLLMQNAPLAISLDSTTLLKEDEATFLKLRSRVANAMHSSP